MSMYRKEWPCCGDVSETNAWEPQECPFCTPAAPAHDWIISRLSTLTRYTHLARDMGGETVEDPTGDYVLVDDVRELFADAPKPCNGSQP